MKFLFLSHSSPFREGGVETRAREVAAAMVRRGHRVIVLCAKTQLDEPAREVRDGIEVRCVKVVPDRWLRRFPFPHYFTLAAANLLLAFYLLAALRREKFDCLREEFCPFPVSSLLAFYRFRSLHRILVVHQLPGAWRSWLHYYGPVFSLVGYFMEKCLRAGWFRFDRFVVPSRYYASRLCANPKLAKKVVLIPNGVMDEFFTEPSARSEPREACRRVVNVGRLVKLKGQSLLIEAVAQLGSRFPDVTLTLVGKGPMLDALRSQARRSGLESRVEFVPSVEHDQIPRFFDGFDLLVMPSLYEGYNVTLLEAIARKLPALVSDIPGFTDVAGGEGVAYFRSEDAADLTSRLAEVIEHPARSRTMAERAFERARPLTWTQIADRELEAFGLAVPARISLGETVDVGA